MSTSLVGSEKALKGKYRLIGIDAFSHEGWIERDDKSLKTLILKALQGCEPDNQDYHVHDSTGRLLWDAEDMIKGGEPSMKAAIDVLIGQSLLAKPDKLSIIRSYRRFVVQKKENEKKIARKVAAMRRKIHNRL